MGAISEYLSFDLRFQTLGPSTAREMPSDVTKHARRGGRALKGIGSSLVAQSKCQITAARTVSVSTSIGTPA